MYVHECPAVPIGGRSLEIQSCKEWTVGTIYIEAARTLELSLDPHCDLDLANGIFVLPGTGLLGVLPPEQDHATSFTRDSFACL